MRSHRSWTHKHERYNQHSNGHKVDVGIAVLQSCHIHCHGSSFFANPTAWHQHPSCCTWEAFFRMLQVQMLGQLP